MLTTCIILGYADHDRAREIEAPRQHWGPSAPRPRPIDPMESASIVPFRKYAQIMREMGTEPSALLTGQEATQELYDKYQEYRLAHTRKTMKQFWEAHKSDKWFVERYGIGENQVQRRNTRRRKGREGRKKVWLEELREGKLDKICWDAKEISPGTTSYTSRIGEEESIEGGDTINIEAETNQALIRQIPAEIGRDEVEAALQEEPGFRYLALGEPHPNKRWGRAGWAIFDSTDDLKEVVEQLNQKTIGGQFLLFEIALRPAQAKIKIAPEYSGSIKRLAHDLTQAKEIVALLQKEDMEILWREETVDESLQTDASTEIEKRLIQIEQTVQGTSEESEARQVALKKELDLHLDLLREVYHCDYYSSLLCDFPEELVRRSPKHLRRVGTREEAIGGEKAWASNLDSKHKLLMRPDDTEIGELGGTSLDTIMMEAAAPYSHDDGEEKHRCTVLLSTGKECSKPFKAQVFVQKHVLNKHKSFIEDIVKDQIDELRYYNNYVRDPQRVMPLMASAPNGPNGPNGRDANNPPNNTNGNGSSMPPLSLRISQETAGGGGGFYGQSGLIRMGGLTTASGGNMDRHSPAAHGGGGVVGGRRGLDEPLSNLLGQRMSAAPSSKALKAEPLPSNPRPLDPRASLAPKRYEDLDASGGGPESGEIDLEY